MRIDNHGVGLEVDIDGPGDGPPVRLRHGISACSATYDVPVPELPEVRRSLGTYAPA